MSMKLVKRFVAISVSILFAISLALLGSPPLQSAWADTSCPPEISSTIPANPNYPLGDCPTASRLTVVGQFAWQTFTALNWPANDQGDPIGSILTTNNPEAPRVWEFYKRPAEIFLPGGQEPKNDPDQKSNPKSSQRLRLIEAGEPDYSPEKDRAFFELAQRKDLLDAKGELTIPVEAAISSNKYPAIDRTGNYILNEIHVNPQEADQIIKNGWYDAKNLSDFNNDTNPFNLSCSELNGYKSRGVPCNGEYGPTGSMELKAAWRVFDDSTSDAEKARYYTTPRTFAFNSDISVTGQPLVQQLEVGLVGFHIVHKTSENGWVWATFEQVDTVPDGQMEDGFVTDEGENSPPFGYTLYTCSSFEDCYKDNKINNPKIPVPPYQWRKASPHAVTSQNNQVIPQPQTQILRHPMPQTNATDAATLQQLNKTWQAALNDTVWQYYKLIGVEWLRSPNLPFDQKLRTITPATPALSNVTLEAYAQNISCIACHTSAALPKSTGQRSKVHSDFSFLLDDAQPAASQ